MVPVVHWFLPTAFTSLSVSCISSRLCKRPKGMLYVVDFFSKKAFLEASIKFPNSLVGMFVITGLLMAIGERNAAPIRKFFAPALDWIAKV